MSRQILFLLTSTYFSHLLHSSTVSLPTFLSFTDRQERQLSHVSSEDRVKSPSEGACICLFLILVYREAATALRLAHEIIPSMMPGLHRISGHLKVGVTSSMGGAPAFANRSVGLKRCRTRRIVQLKMIFIHVL